MGKKIIWVITGIGFLIGASYDLYNKNVERGFFKGIILLSENFESGIIPSNWIVIDGNNDGVKWEAGTTPDLENYTPPNYETAYAYYSDDDAGKNVINYNEELITPKININGIAQLKFKYSYGFHVFDPGEKFYIHFRKKTDNSWTQWIKLKVYEESSSGEDSMNLTEELPCDSIQFRFFYSDSTSFNHWGYACAVDNVTLEGLPPFNHDVGVIKIISPEEENLIGVSVNVIVKYKNLGNNTETFPAIVRIIDSTNTAVFLKDTNLTLNQGEQIEVNFGLWIPFKTGLYFIYTKTLLPFDEYPQNDSTGYSLIVKDLSSWKRINQPWRNYHRLSHATVYDPDNDKIYMIGGTPNGEVGSNVPYIYRYDPVTDTWETNLSPMPEARGWIQGGYWNGKIYVPGGFTNSGTNSNTFYIYDISSNSWTIGPPLPEKRFAYGLAVWNGNIYVIGGYTDSGTGSKTVYRFNIANNQWTVATSIPLEFDMGGCCYLGDTIYLVGGYRRSANQVWTRILRGIIDNQNPDNITWTWGAYLPYSNFNNAACALPGKIYMIGGFKQGTLIERKVWEYDITKNEWKQLTPYIVPIVRNNFACARPEKGGHGPRIYIIAGDANCDWKIPNNYYYYIEKGILNYEESLKDNPKILFINPSIIKDDFRIHLNLKRKSNINISIYNLTGREIAKIYEGIKEPGEYVIKYNCRNLIPGIYFIILKTHKTYSFKIIKLK